MISRSLLLPGPQPPLSHLGVTLLRHCVTTGLRYSLYHLGLPLPEKPPVRITRLRLYLDGPALTRQLGDEPAAGEIVAALVEPGGTGTAGMGRSAAAAWFHRTRLLLRRRSPTSHPEPRRGEDSAAALSGFQSALSQGLERLNDAFLGEVVSALARRRRRARGRAVEPCLSRNAAGLTPGDGRLPALGPPDLLTPAWSDLAEARSTLAEATPGDALPRPDRLRGGFRDGYRALLDSLRPPFLALAADAVRRGALPDETSASFLPFDLLPDLGVDPPPAWLAPAVAANRREYESLLELPGPPEVLPEGKAALDPDNAPASWPQGAVWPLS